MADRHFLVVGGTKGTGKVLVRHIAAIAGNCVSVFGRSPDASVTTARMKHYPVDVTDRKALLSGLDRAVKHFGKLATVIFMQRHRAREEEFEKDLAVSLVATKNAIEYLVERGHFLNKKGAASIVMVSSIADRYVAPEQPAGYHVGKAGLSQLARFYALKLGPLGIRVNSVSPCVVAKHEARAFYRKNKILVEKFRKFIPLGRMGTPEDIVSAIMFLACDQASYITGQNIVVDGGLTLRSHESLIRDS